MKITALFIAGLLISPLSQASSDITVTEAYARATPPMATTSAVFAHINNHSKQARTLVSAHSLVAKNVELHDVIKEDDVMKMRQVKQIALPANQATNLQPGGLHIMLINLNQPLKEGSNIEVRLTFDDNSSQDLTVPVKRVSHGMKMHK